MRKLLLALIALLLLTGGALSAGVNTASLGGFYAYERVTQRWFDDSTEEVLTGHTVGLQLKKSSSFQAMGNFGFRYDLRAGKLITLDSTLGTPETLGGLGVDFGAGMIYQHPVTYISYLEGGLGVRAVGSMHDYSINNINQIDHHIFLAAQAFIDYNHALRRNLLVNVGATAKMPLIGYAKLGAKSAPSEGWVSLMGVELSPYLGVSYLF